MTINETQNKSNPKTSFDKDSKPGVSHSMDALPDEEEFDIVSVNKPQKRDVRKHLINIALLILLVTASFGLGRFTLYEENKVPVVIRNDTGLEEATLLSQNGDVKGATTNTVEQSGGEVIASKKGTKYHYPWCSGGKTISPANRITFSSLEEARKAGYTPAANCKGLK